MQSDSVLTSSSAVCLTALGQRPTYLSAFSDSILSRRHLTRTVTVARYSEGTVGDSLESYSYVKEPNNVVAAGAILPLFDDAIVVHLSNTLQILGQLFSFF